MPTSIKVDSNMKQPLEKLAKEQLVPVMSLINKALPNTSMSRALTEDGRSRVRSPRNSLLLF
jgi:hypothetical protein